MSTHRHIDRICCAALVLVLVVTLLFMGGENLGLQASAASMGYETRLFDAGTVHTLDIVMDDWEGFLESCEDEEYAACSVVIDNEAYKNVGLRAKGNTSLSSVKAYGNDRYSFKIEFDHYEAGKTYHGLDKLCLNNIIQDNTYLKDFLSYQMMGYFGVAAPLCSFVYITVNGEDWGLYLAVEGVEESFLQRNYGTDYGQLYKPDSQSMGGGRGNGRDFDPEEMEQQIQQWQERQDQGWDQTQQGGFGGGRGMPVEDQRPEMEPADGVASAADGAMETPPGSKAPDFGGGAGGQGGMVMGSSDVSLIYSDDEYGSYSNIFDNAKTDAADADKDRLIAALKTLNSEAAADAVDVDAVLHYFVVHNFLCNFDSYTGSIIHNYYLYEEDGILSMIPWDYNLAFGGFQSMSGATALVNYPIDTPVSGGSVDSRPMLAWIFSDEEYTALYHQYFQQFVTEYFDSGYFTQLFEQTAAMIAPYVERDPTKFCTYEEFETGLAALKEFCLLRAQSVSGQLDGTIPSTSEGQSADSSALVDASGISISDMGSMGAGMGGHGGMDGAPGERDGEGHGMGGMPDGQQPSRQEGGGLMGPPSEMPDGQQAAQTGSTAGTSWAMIGLSAVALLAGLLVVIKYKRW